MKQIELSKIKPYENNPRNNKEAIEYVANSIREFGFHNPILLDPDFNIISGHTRYEASKILELDKVPCIIIKDLSDDQIKALRIADNKTSEISTWNYDLLDLEMKDLDFNFLDFGFSPVEIETNFKEVNFEEEKIEFSAPLIQTQTDEKKPSLSDHPKTETKEKREPLKRVKMYLEFIGKKADILDIMEGLRKDGFGNTSEDIVYKAIKELSKDLI